MASRQDEFRKYFEKYTLIPNEYDKRLEWLVDECGIKNKIIAEVIELRDKFINEYNPQQLKIILYEEPKGAPRPRFRVVNRYNAGIAAMQNYIRVYSLDGKADNAYMKQLIDSNSLNDFQGLLYFPCNVEFNAFIPTPSTFSNRDKLLAEIGIIRPLNKPDWDNIGKKYSDMFNENIWLDDTLVVDGSVRKFYSVKPRVEVNLSFINILYNKYQYHNIVKRLARLGIDTNNINYFI